MATSHPIPTHANFKNLMHKRIGKLEVIDYAGPEKGHQLWICRCDCGTICVKRANNLLTPGHTTSCGCTFVAKRKKGTNLRHGHAHKGKVTVEYSTWVTMKERCFNEGTKAYEQYGGAGRTVCEGWKNSFDSFFADLGQRPSKGHSIDRIDNDGHYSCGHCPECIANGWPMNCRWATRLQQAANTKTNIYLTVQGVTRPLSEWAHMHGLKPQTLWMRLKRGWDHEKAVLTPLRVQ